MKKIFVAVLLLAGFAATAQEEAKEAGLVAKPITRSSLAITPEKRADKLKTELNLTDEQQLKVTAVFEEQQKQREEMIAARKPGVRPDREQMREESKKRTEELNAKMKSILTDEQYTKWQNSRKRAMPKQGELKPSGVN